MANESEDSAGHVETAHCMLPRSRAEQLSATLGIEIRDADAVPRMWHYLYFWPKAALHQIGPDGHPVVGVPVPPAPGMRRMFAGTSVRWYGPLLFDEAAVRTRAVIDTQTKQGRTGELVLVKVRDDVVQRDALRLTETQTIVYRKDDGTTRAPVTSGAPAGATPVLALDVDERVVFRYSALTLNTHRIHYDQRWASHEGYSDIVVQGPLQAALLAAARSRTSPHAEQDVGVDIRFSAPLVGPQRVTVCADPMDADAAVTVGADGRVAASGRWLSASDGAEA